MPKNNGKTVLGITLPLRGIECVYFCKGLRGAETWKFPVQLYIYMASI